MTLVAVMEAVLEALVERSTLEERLARQLTTERLEEVVLNSVGSLRPDVALEIGAHEATFSQKVMRMLPGTNVIAFEANPRVHERYADTLTELGIDYRHQAIAPVEGVVTFTIPVGRERMGSLLDSRVEESSETVRVSAAPLDKVVPADARRVAMWVDVEGAALDVLEGGAETLARTDLFYVEVETTHRWRAGGTLDGLVELLGRYGLAPVLTDVARKRWQRNVLFVRTSIPEFPLIENFAAQYCRDVARELLAR